MTRAEIEALKAQTEADLARAQVERDAAALDVDAAQQLVIMAMNELATKNIFLSNKVNAVNTAQMMLNYYNMMLQMQQFA